MDNAWLYALTFVSILTAVRCWFRSHRYWEQLQRQGRSTENILNSKNLQICEARMQADNSRADVIKLYAVIQAKDLEIEELISQRSKRGPFAMKSA